MANFEITTKGEKTIEKVMDSSEGKYLNAFELALLLYAREGKLETTDIETKYGTLGSRVIKDFKKKGLISTGRNIRDREKCSRCGIEANYPLTYTDKGPLCQTCIDAT